MLDARERQRAIDLALLQMDKQFGKGAVLRMGSRTIVPVDVIPSGSISLDAALGVGGFPRGLRRKAARRSSWTPSTRWTPSTHANSVWMSTTSWFPSRITANRPWKSPRPL